MILVLTAFYALAGHIRGKARSLKEKNEKDEEQFFEFLIELSENLDSGNNMINAIKTAQGSMPEGCIKNALLELVTRLKLNYSMDEAFFEISHRFDSTLIKNWCRMISLAYQKGACLQKAIRDNRDLFVLKKRTTREVKTILAKQRLNLHIIKFMPFAIMSILLSSAKEISYSLYTKGGRIVMTIAFLLIITAEYIARRITKL